MQSPKTSFFTKSELKPLPLLQQIKENQIHLFDDPSYTPKNDSSPNIRYKNLFLKTRKLNQQHRKLISSYELRMG